MNWKSTLALVALAGLSGLWVWKGDAWAVRMNLRDATPAAPSSPSLAALDADFAADKITRVEIATPGDSVVLEHSGSAWRTPGNWPLRATEADELVRALAGLRTRFQPLPADDLAAFGLAADQKPTEVKVTANGKSYTLLFGEPPATDGTPAFTRPAFVRVNDFPDVLRIGPDTLPLLRRPAEAYRKRQLFSDADRVKMAGVGPPPSPFAPPTAPTTSTVSMLGDKVSAVSVRGPGSTATVLGIAVPIPDGTFTLKRTAPLPRSTNEKGAEEPLKDESVSQAWELAAPVRDRVDPAALRRVLTAVPELWVEEFADPTKARLALDHPAAIAAALPVFEPVLATLARHHPTASLADPIPKADRQLLAKPERTLAVTRSDGTVVTIQFGGIAKVGERDETISMPGGPPGMPPQSRTIKVPEEYRYAKVVDAPFIFVVKAAPLADVFAKLDAVQDTRVARFDADAVKEVTIAAKGLPPVKLTRQKETDKPEKWFLDAKPAPVAADPAKVNELIGQLAALQSDGTATDPVDPQAGTRVTVSAGTKTVVLTVNKADAGRLAVRVDGWPRVALVSDAVAKVLDRPAHEFLDRNLLVMGDAPKLGTITITTPKPDQTITLKKDAAGAWKADGAAFAVDAITVGQLTAALAPFPVKSVAAYGDAVKWADFGLDPPEFTLTVGTTGDKPESHTIALGKADPTGGRFVRIDGGKAVGVIDAPTATALAKSKPDFVDRTLLTFDPTALTGFARKKGADDLEIVPGAAVGWDVVKPSKQKADPVLMEQLAAALGRLRADRVVAQGPKDAVFKAHGLDTPAATITLTVGEKGDTKVLKLGTPVDPKQPDGDRHAAVEGAGTEAVVGVLSADLSSKLLAAPNAFRDRTLAKFVDADKLTLERGDRTITFAKADGGWKAEGLTVEVESQELDDFVTRLEKLQAAEIVADKPKADELKKFGLDKPEAKWTVSANGAAVVVLLIGKKDSTAQRAYAKTEKGDVVGILPPDVTSRALAEYRRRKAWDGVDALQTESVEVKRGKAAFVLAKRGPVWIDPAKPGDFVDPRAATELVAALAALKAERFVADKDADVKLFGLAEPEVVITVTQRDGMRKVLHVGGSVGGVEGKQVYAKVADPARTDVFVLSEADTARFLRERAAYLEKKDEKK